MLPLTIEKIGACCGDLHAVLPPLAVGPILVACSLLAGMIIGFERRAHRKPAGLRTLMMICLGSTIYTLASIMIAGEGGADRGRIAAQIVSGIGFLGAGVIMRDAGSIHGLTTAATIWAVAAVGLLIGAGFAVPGLSLAIVMLVVLMMFRADGEERSLPDD